MQNMCPVVEHLPSMHEALGSILSTTKKKKKRTKKREMCVSVLPYLKVGWRADFLGKIFQVLSVVS
jgi:hypothetical protein